MKTSHSILLGQSGALRWPRMWAQGFKNLLRTAVVLLFLGRFVLSSLGAGLTVDQVTHLPAQPKPGESVTVTARVNAADPVQAVTLQIQLVEPGRFIRKTDRAYTNTWREFPMQAGTGTNLSSYTAIVPAELQKHRHLLRYRIAVQPASGAPALFPAATNASPNFAWFTYGGVPAWTGASKPGSTPPLVFSSEFMSTLPAYHLIARADDVQNSQWNQGANRKPFLGALVYDGKVYDHIQFHNRGQASTYVAGKNKWAFRLNPGQYFQARDAWGRRYTNGWSGFNLNACASPWAQVNRGMAGMDEAVSYRAYQLAGVPGPDTHWIQFRVIDAAEEASPRSQFEGDVWGLYLVVEEKNGTWLREKGLPEGNIYSAESGQKHQGKSMPTNSVDWNQFMGQSGQRQTVGWWRTNMDLNAYYSFHAMNDVLANIDLREGGNHYLYHRKDGPWVVLPHDLDMMFIPKTHWPGIVQQSICLEHPALRLEFKNRGRETLDLFCSDAATNGGQIGQLVAEMAGQIAPAGQARNWAQLDEAMWNYHPRNNDPGQFYRNPVVDNRMGGDWRRKLATPDFAGFCKYIVDFCTDSRPNKNYAPNDGNQFGYGYGFLFNESRDAFIPPRPSLRYSGAPGYAADQLKFAISMAEAKSQDAVAVEWRVAEISAPGLAGFQPGTPCRYEIEKAWTSAPLASSVTEVTAPANVCQPGHTYRARVHVKDSAGRWSRWSEPVQFVAAKPAGK